MKDPRLRLTAPMRNMLMLLFVVAMLLCGARVPAALPVPKEGLLIRKDRANAVRRALLSLLDEPVVIGKRGIRTVADQAVLDWPAVKAEVEPHVDELLDLQQDRNPKEYVSDDARGAAKRLSEMVHATRNEVLCCTGGLAWHFPWHQYAVTESVLETEGEPFSPSMVITDSFDGQLLSVITAESGPSNVSYYPRPGQITSHRGYKHRTRDDRFAARNLIDNKTWEVPIDGVVDYTLGTIATTGNGGYGRGPLPYDRDLSTWELYFRPTYWLLPPGQPGQITIKLKEPTRLKLIRLLNTTNAGLNDFATVGCRLELLADDNTPLWSRDLSFGRRWDRAFQAAFARPEFFGSYGEAFQGILEPGVIVPFGAGWLEVPVDLHSKVRSIRLSINKFWVMGGGLNEIQAYASPAP